ncbi:hypothetical protein WJX72_001392 [[Myrmecia] bisecta]|uniref:Thioredoxin domain-containing protein n=1 Tax=[Myrmecia] bisecta TaxID=41462 RepID=A0AAW1R549_9CHLO
MAPTITNVSSEAAFDAALVSSPQVAAHFWASWCEPCKHMDSVLCELAEDYTQVTFLRVEAEEVSDIAERFGVSAVPYFLLFKNGKVVDKVEGADVAALTACVGQHFRAAPTGQPPGAPAPAASAVEGKPVLTARLQQLIKAAPVVLFMKGTPDTPRCGFSQKVVGLLRQHGAHFNSFDILSDESVRQGLKQYSQWPTYPQLYIDSEFVGGCDVVTELHETGELKDLLDRASHVENTEDARVRKLMNSSDVMLFMKGTPQEPRCGFSRRVVEALNATGELYGSFDILSDEVVRQGLKAITDWPTYPQLLVHGELVGGCDIVTELHTAGELKTTIEEMKSRMQKAA